MARKIEPGKKASDIFAGCAPVEWVKQVASDFHSFVWGKILDVAKAVKNAIGSLINNVGNWLQGFFKGTIAAVEATGRFVASYGLVAIVGRKLAETPCGRIALAAGAVVVGGVATFAGLKALAATASIMAFGVPLLARVIRGMVRGVSFAYNFNWNITNSEIQSQIKSLQTRLASSFGGALGQGIGQLACGGLAGVTIMTLNPRVAVKMSEALGDDVLDEVKDAMRQLLQQTGAIARQYAFLESFKSARSYVKRLAKYPYISRILPDKWENIIKAWGNEGSKSWSFASAVEEKIESISDERLKAFVEELADEFMDACSDSMLAISYGM